VLGSRQSACGSTPRTGVLASERSPRRSTTAGSRRGHRRLRTVRPVPVNPVFLDPRRSVKPVLREDVVLLVLDALADRVTELQQRQQEERFLGPVRGLLTEHIEDVYEVDRAQNGGIGIFSVGFNNVHRQNPGSDWRAAGAAGISQGNRPDIQPPPAAGGTVGQTGWDGWWLQCRILLGDRLGPAATLTYRGVPNQTRQRVADSETLLDKLTSTSLKTSSKPSISRQLRQIDVRKMER